MIRGVAAGFGLALIGQLIMGSQPLPKHGPPVPLEVQFSVTQDALNVAYRIRNTRPQPIYLFNVLWTSGKTQAYEKSPMPAYVCVKGGRGIHIAEMILPNPKLKKVEQRIIPFTTKVDPGQMYTGAFRLALPVKEFSEYYPFEEGSSEEPITAEAVLLTVQYVEQQPHLDVKPSPLGEGFEVDHPNIFGIVETVQSQPYHARIPALKRKDQFEDF